MRGVTPTAVIQDEANLFFGAEPTVLFAPAPVNAPGLAEHFDPQPNPYIADPKRWMNERVQRFIWSAQVKILNSVRDNRYTAVQSAHDTGKSFIAAHAAAWWLDVHPIGEAFVVTTAPTQPQVNAILWREIRAAHRKGGLDGRITMDAHWYMGDNELVAYGRKPADYADTNQAMQAFQGIHARYVLVILDEACGIPKWLYDATDSLATNDNSRVLAIGNPDDPASQFEKVCRPGSGWNQMEISVFDTPAFTGEEVPSELLEVLVGRRWVEERKKRWGVGSPLYQSKVLGKFPDISDDTLIPPKWIREAQERDLSGNAISTKGRYGADIARKGADHTVVMRNRGGHVRCEYERHRSDTMETANNIFRLSVERSHQVPITVDADGLGAGVYDRLNELNAPVQPFHGAARPTDTERYYNLRAERYWQLREAFENGEIDIDPYDEDLASQLGSMKWKMLKGKIVIESKDDLAKRGMPSPDRADAVMYSWDFSEHSYRVFDEIAEQEAGESLTDDLMDRRF